VIGAKGLEDGDKRQRKMVYLLNPRNYNLDTKTYGSFERVRRDHLEKLGLEPR